MGSAAPEGFEPAVIHAVIPPGAATHQHGHKMHQIISKEISMTSREIAGLTDKEHRHVLRDIEVLKTQLGVEFGGCAQNWTHPQNGQTYTEYALDKDTTICLVSGYSATVRMRIIKRWQELEAKASTGLIAMPNFSNPAEAARAWAAQYEARQLAEQTKAQIGHRREATAMNTASQAVKKANKLEIELDRSKDYATVKRMQMIHHGQPFNWRVLKSTAAEMEIPPIDVFDQNYGTVKAYHADVWREAYAVEIEFTEPAANQQTQEAA
jgi:phage regulator Rha-like protein